VVQRVFSSLPLLYISISSDKGCLQTRLSDFEHSQHTAKHELQKHLRMAVEQGRASLKIA